ncbi:MAG TPA: radical SAM protein [Bryobacteraceae bacterium]|nr:radical SAM protein [Bryobacteraceae bacterium]
MQAGCVEKRDGVIARSILSPASGYIAEAGFTHSLTPARNCTFGCTYCYVPTLGIYGGLKLEDWQRWGQFTTFKQNAPDLLRRELRASLKKAQRIYCSPLVDPYQPAEAEEQMMPRILDELIKNPPRVFCLQTRGVLILRDLDRLRALGRRATLRVSFSITTNRDEVRRLYEPHCADNEERLRAICRLREAGIETFATLAPILPCDPEELARMAIDASGGRIIGDPLHIRSTKRHGATTREAAFRIARARGHEDWLEAEFQAKIVERIGAEARRAGVEFETGPRGFARLARENAA